MNDVLKINKTITICIYGFVFVLSLVCITNSAHAQENVSTTTASPASVASENVVSKPQGYTIDQLESQTDKAVGDFVVGPGKTALTIAPGTSKVVEITVANRTGKTNDFILSVEDAEGSNDTQAPVVLLGTDTGPYTLKDYISFQQDTITLQNNERARIPVTISVPANADPGGRYGSVLVSVLSKKAVVSDDEEVTGATSAVFTRIGTLFFITIPGDTDVEGELQSFKTLPDKTFFTQGPINFQLLFANKGDLHLTPYGEINVTNMFNENVGFIELDPWFVLPKSLRSREVLWERELLLGRYTATVQVNRGYDDIIDTQAVTFWVLPWKVVLGVFGLLLFVSLVIRFIVKNFEFKRK